MYSASSSTPSPASTARSLSSYSGSSAFPLPHRLRLRRKISDQRVMASPAVPSFYIKASTWGGNRPERIRKAWLVERLKSSFFWNSHLKGQLTPCIASHVFDGYGHRYRRRRWKVSLTAAYRRIPMDTSGAYRLIDDDTGENFIIWGGADDDSPIPSKETLSWKPKDNTVQGGGHKIVSGALGSFGRLKVPKVRALMKNSTASGGSFHRSPKASPFVTLLEEAESLNSHVHYASEDGSMGFLRDGELNDIPINTVRQQLVNSEGTTLSKGLSAEDAYVSAPGVTSPLRHWKNSGSTQSIYASRKKHHKTLPYDGGFFSRKSFRDLGCCNFMIESLEKQSIVCPSHIQAMAYSPVLEGKSCIIADQSGSGKTLAYLAPVVQRLREEELSGLGKSSSKSPRVVILAPTAELASQLLHNCRSMAKCGVPFRSAVATGGFRQKTQLDTLQQELDVLIATPGRFMFLLKENHIQLNNLKCVVLDEVDILFNDEDFEQVLQSLIRSASITVQYLFVTATLPVDIYQKLIEVFPDSQVVMGPGIHRTSSRLDEVLVDCSGVEGEEKNPDTAFLNKKTALLKLVEDSPVPKTIIFCNKIETCRKVENALKRFDRKEIHLKVLPFHAALAKEPRISNMEEFLKSETKEALFLICTDRASRGIDFANVDHVILFDFPREPSEYVRRVGRTARGATGRGKAYVFVVGKQVSLAKSIIERNKKGHPLHDVPQAYELQSSVL